MDKYKVLIVEDEAIIAFELKMIMEQAGFAVTHVVYNAVEAVQCAEEDRPDVIIMDVLLKGDENGIHVAERINGVFKVPVLFITGNSQMIDRFDIKNISSYIIMTKPPLESEIIKNVRMLAVG